MRESLGSDAEIVELIQTLSQTPYKDLPEAARARIGIQENQKNILLRVVLRSYERTLTSEECNIYRDKIYAAVHKGSAWQWVIQR